MIGSGLSLSPKWQTNSSLDGAAAEVLDGRVDEPDADVILGAGPAVGRDLVLHAGVAVFVLDGVLIDALAEDALLLGVDDDARAPVRGAHSSMLRSASTVIQSKVWVESG